MVVKQSEFSRQDDDKVVMEGKKCHLVIGEASGLEKDNHLQKT